MEQQKEVRTIKKKIKNNIPFKFTNNANEDEHVMVISGAIGESGWFYDATSAQDVRNALDGVKASTIRIKLNSGGGDAMDGIEIMNYLKDLDAHVIVEVTALAASAASILAMGADEVIMRDGATLMIHEASTFAYGTKSDIQKTMNALEAIDKSLVDIYVNKTGLSSEEISGMLKAETWLTGPEAVEKGFATSMEKQSTVEEDEEVSLLKAQMQVMQNELQQLKNTEPEKPTPVKQNRAVRLF